MPCKQWPSGYVYNRYLTGDMAHYYSTPGSSTKKAAGSQPQFSMALELYIDKPKFTLRRRSTLNQGTPTQASMAARKRSATTTEVDGIPLNKCHAIPNAGRRIESTFIRTSHTNNSSIDASTVVQLKKAHTTCNTETGEVEIEWLENASLHEAVLGKEVFAADVGTISDIFFRF
ncbi:hypothetical protein BYT27DRAFT_7209052 [Phlegmacium glaucopus]|nr:hypothetical protein BYT27DRAFT_7209052 [Phlegmacium glaucopus]